MKQRQITVDPTTSLFLSLRAGDAFLLVGDIQDNNSNIYIVMEELPDFFYACWPEGYEKFNAISICDGEQIYIRPNDHIIPVEAEATWRLKIVQ